MEPLPLSDGSNLIRNRDLEFAVYECNSLEDYLTNKDLVEKGKNGLIAMIRGSYLLDIKLFSDRLAEGMRELSGKSYFSDDARAELSVIADGLSSDPEGVHKSLKGSPFDTIYGTMRQQFIRDDASAELVIYNYLFKSGMLSIKNRGGVQILTPYVKYPAPENKDGILCYFGDDSSKKNIFTRLPRLPSDRLELV